MGNEGLPYKNKRVICPHCGDEFAISVTWEIGIVKKIPNQDADFTATSAEEYWLSTLDETTKEILEGFKNSSALDAFRRTWMEVNGGGHPKIVAKTFLAWCRTAVSKKMPPQVSSFLMREYPSQTIRMVVGNNVAGILVDEVLTQLLPVSLVDGDAIKGNGIIRSVKPDTDRLELWIRTKYGYVSGRGLMLDEMRRKSIGAFDRPGVTST